MATIKIACPKCGQKVSGDESFSGTIVECPICSSQIKFPSDKEKFADTASSQKKPGKDEEGFTPESPVPPAASPEAPPAQEESLPLPSEESLRQGHQGSQWADVDDEIPSPLFGAISLVCGILGIVTCIGGFLFAPLAIIFGHIALARGKHSPVQPPPGRNLAMFGVIIGYLNLLLLIVVLVGMVFFKEPVTQFIQQLQQQ